ncbi:MAG TPA: hypothetical protein VMG13_18670 [Trebonia sp.]|nr:hypothetical protein [Trebonia sp.]
MTDAGAGSGRVAVLAPGGGYGPDGPLLMFSAVAARRRGAEVRAVAWEFERGAEAHAMVARTVAAALDEEAPKDAVVFGKSLGSMAAPVIAERGLPAVWFTPLLTDPAVVAALGGAAGPFLLAGGTADPYWDGEIARSVTPYVVEAADADHGMFVPGRLAASAAVLGDVMTAVERFLDEVAWMAPAVS